MADDLIPAMRQALADTWGYYFEAHSFHWNVQGPLFPQLHKFFGDIYEDAFDAVDGLSEQIRSLGEMAPTSLTELDQTSAINSRGIPDASGMIEALKEDNELVMESLGVAQKAAEASGEVGLSNYLQDRLDKHKKWGWMLEASSEGKVPELRPRRIMRYNHPSSA